MPIEAETDGAVTVHFSCEGLPAGALIVTQLRVREAVSRLPEIRVSLLGNPDRLNPSELLGRPAKLSCEAPDGTVLRLFHGVISEASLELHLEKQRVRLHLQLSSPLFALGLSTDRTVFTEKSATDVVKALFERIGLPSSAFVFRCDPQPKPRPSITLPGDSLLAVYERLLEEEGLASFTVYRDEGPLLVVGAGTGLWETPPEAVSFVYTPRGLTLAGLDTVVGEEAYGASGVRLLDHDPTKPAMSMTTEAAATSTPAAIVEQWPGGHPSPAAGKTLAKTYLAGLRERTKGIRVTGSSPQLTPGHRFSLTDTPHNLDGGYIALEVQHTFILGKGYRSRARAILDDTAYVPERRSARVRTSGPTTAWVVGPSGAVVHTDDHGRSKVRFPWDRAAKDDATSSAFARVLSPMLLSSQVIPRVGWGVLVDFEDGDPDRPVILGRLFDGHHPPPHPLPAARKTSALVTQDIVDGQDFHEIRFDDTKDAELLHLHAAKDYVLDVGKDRRETVVSAESWQIKVDRTVTIEENETRTREKNRQRTIGGSLTHTVKKDWKTDVTGDYRLTVTKDHLATIDDDVSWTVTGTDSLTTTGNVTIDLGSLAETSSRFDLAIGKTSSLRVTGNLEEKADGGIFESVKANYSLDAAASGLVVKGNATIASKGALKITTKAAETLSAGKDMELSSGAALTMKGAAVTLTGNVSFTIQVGSNKLTVGKGGVSIAASKIKIEGSGPVIVGVGLVGSK